MFAWNNFHVQISIRIFTRKNFCVYGIKENRITNNAERNRHFASSMKHKALEQDAYCNSATHEQIKMQDGNRQ